MQMQLVGTTYLVAGSPEAIEGVLAFLKSAGIETRANPDLYVREHRRFGIDEARELRARATLRPIGEGGRRVFVIAAPDMNREAQNALLKMTEEPPGNALFFFIVPSPETLLPTLRSRVQTLVLDEEKGSRKGVVDARQFLSALPQKRLDLLKQLLERGDDEKRDLGAILAFLSALEAALAKTPLGKGREGVEAVYRARKYVTDKGALVKPLLEQVALLAPRVVE